MNKPRLVGIVAAGALFLAATALAQAQNTQWVANNGVDSGSCTIAAPCATFQRAHDNAPPGGSVAPLNDGQYGSLVISKSITIDGHGHFAGINRTTPGSAISVAPTLATDAVVIRGLTLDGIAHSGTDGINFSTGASLLVENCTIKSFNLAGINVQRTTAAKVSIVNVTSSNNNTGILLNSTGGTLSATIDGANLHNNVGDGLRVESNTNCTVRDSDASGNENGFRVFSGAGTASDVNLEGCVAANNSNAGFFSQIQVTIPTMRISNCTATGNFRGLFANGNLLSYGNNRVAGNNVNGAPTGAIPQV
jgi:hypothetical protein